MKTKAESASESPAKAAPKKKRLPTSRNKVHPLVSKCWDAASYAYASKGCHEPPNLDFLHLEDFISWHHFDDCQDVEALKVLLPNQHSRRRGESQKMANDRAEREFKAFLNEWNRGFPYRWALFSHAEKSYLHGLLVQLWSGTVFTSHRGFTLEAQFEAIQGYSRQMWDHAQGSAGATIKGAEPEFSVATIEEIVERALCIIRHQIDDTFPTPKTVEEFRRIKQPLQISQNELLFSAANLFGSSLQLLMKCLQAAVFANAEFFETLSNAIKGLRDRAHQGSFGVLTAKKEDQHAYAVLTAFVDFTREKERLPRKFELEDAFARVSGKDDLAPSAFSDILKDCGLTGLRRGAKGDRLKLER